MMPRLPAARRRGWITLRLVWIVPLGFSLLLTAVDQAPVAASHGRAFLEFLRGNFDPVWSPDGRHLAFTSSSENAWEVTVLDTQAATQQSVGKGSAATWSPDGRGVAFIGEEEIRTVHDDRWSRRRFRFWRRGPQARGASRSTALAARGTSIQGPGGRCPGRRPAAVWPSTTHAGPTSPAASPVKIASRSL